MDVQAIQAFWDRPVQVTKGVYVGSSSILLEQLPLLQQLTVSQVLFLTETPLVSRFCP